ncbi:MarR family winged helix-turn-helix transcriptional regulator [Sphingomonas hankyongi]|uniref:MarR family winged helix-turn-helix transcriptional regulator n=1 Tax=Sphingomonas hankyongi TaxID=2908209 RepID=A0ABT0S1N4_9SPHN|nr:MarR family winged helix-turn-helix transcriptional regulator [Sphingomonas hankyongi]MCL6729768.1 MarR family winged helix-turn-helix transcriptional regulator [Sphingomonas hankyongi]
MASDLSRTAQGMLDRCLFQRTRAAARAVTRLYDNELRSIGLRATQAVVLATVAAKGELSISALSDELEMDRTTLTRNLRPLEDRRLLAVSAEGRHRTRLVSLLPAGEAMLGLAADRWEQAQTSLEQSLGAVGVAPVRKAIAAITKSASRAAG